MKTRAQEWQVAQKDANTRVDRFLLTKLPVYSRHELHQTISQKKIFVNGRPAPKGLRLRPGDILRVILPVQLHPNLHLDLPVLYEDSACIAIDKPRGLPSVALKMTDSDTVANFLAAASPESVTVGHNPRDAGLIHRLDTATSGVLLASRTPAAYAKLKKQFHNKTVYKEYRAIVEGNFRLDGEVMFFLAPYGLHRRRMQVVPSGQGQEAVSRYEILEHRTKETFIRIVIKTGIRHQIRSHLASLGHPIKGDHLYGSPAQHDNLMLHAHILEFHHPVTTRRTRVTSPLPGDFQPD